MRQDPVRQTSGYTAETELVRRALAGEQAAVQSVMGYLGAANSDLRHIIQEAMHRSLERSGWEQLLHCLAHECWQAPPATPGSAGEGGLPAPGPLMREAQEQSIIEVFVLDESQAETAVKNAVLADGLQSTDRKVRYAAAYLGGLRGDLGMIPLLEAMIVGEAREHPKGQTINDLKWQLRAVQALTALDDPRCGPPLVKALAQGDETLHLAARRALSDLGARAEPAWLEALHHPDSHIRWHAARGLGALGDPRAVDLLMDGLYDENQAVRWATARILASLDSQAVPAILQALASRPLTEGARQAAIHALHSMTESRTQTYVRPLLDSLRSRSASVEAPLTAKRMLLGWKNFN